MKVLAGAAAAVTSGLSGCVHLIDQVADRITWCHHHHHLELQRKPDVCVCVCVWHA